VVELLRSPHDVDWETGEVTDGDDVPAAAAALLTRRAAGPNGGNYQLGLTFRSIVANTVDATALVSIHHNTVPETNLDHPGTEAFVSVSNPDSARLGGLIVDELRRAFARFEADWTGSPGDGLISRVDPDGSDYYSLLDRAEVPAVIVEGAYISNPTEEALAQTDEFQQAYAEGVYRALIRFVTTDDDPIPAPEPILWDVDRPPPSLSSCQVPAP
jgi:N-acetylmuramoyl-L-alanine amidase